MTLRSLKVTLRHAKNEPPAANAYDNRHSHGIMLHVARYVVMVSGRHVAMYVVIVFMVSCGHVVMASGRHVAVGCWVHVAVV